MGSFLWGDFAPRSNTFVNNTFSDIKGAHFIYLLLAWSVEACVAE